MMPRPAPTRAWAILTWPNRIALLRLGLVAPFVMLIMQHHEHPLYRYGAMAVFVVMAVSDFLDGYLARRLNCVTHLGKILDPLADKVLIATSVMLLSLEGSAVAGARLPPWVAVIVLGKDLWVLVGFLVLFLLTGKVHVQPNIFGKLCTAGQLVMVTTVLLVPELNAIADGFGTVLARIFWWAVAGLSILAATTYTRQGIAILGEADPNDRHSQKQDNDSSSR